MLAVNARCGVTLGGPRTSRLIVLYLDARGWSNDRWLQLQWRGQMRRPTSKARRTHHVYTIHCVLHQRSGPDRVPGNLFPAREIYFPGINIPNLDIVPVFVMLYDGQ